MVSSSTRGSCNIFPKLPLSWDFPAAQQPKIRRRRAVATCAAASNKYLSRLGVRPLTPLTWQRQHNKRTTAAMPGMMMIIISQGAGFPTESQGDEPQITGQRVIAGVQPWGQRRSKMEDGRLGIWPTGSDWAAGMIGAWFVSNQGYHHHHTGVVQATWCHCRGLIPPVIPLHECQFVAQQGPTIWNLFNGKM